MRIISAYPGAEYDFQLGLPAGASRDLFVRARNTAGWSSSWWNLNVQPRIQGLYCFDASNMSFEQLRTTVYNSNPICQHILFSIQSTSSIAADGQNMIGVGAWGFLWGLSASGKIYFCNGNSWEEWKPWVAN